MEFRTKFNIPKEQNGINHHNNLVLIGSCFTQNMANKLNYFKFQNSHNPFGILFHPLAIEKALNICIANRKYTAKDLYFFKEHWLSFNHHSAFNAREQNTILNQINVNIETTHQALKNASHLIITLGTAWAYRFKETNDLVANCHKIQQSEFSKELISTESIIQGMKNIIALFRDFNPNINLIFTVSPVRHLKDGVIENTQSKSILHTAIHALTELKNVFYFPAYEIMMDDLRDYRFYKSDMVHPNQTAVDYIWEQFKNTWIDEASIKLMEEIEVVQKSLAHQPFDEKSEPHQKFLKKLYKKMEEITRKHPSIHF